ncbi:hypothetical protein EZ449_05255 [Pedobacter frigidisoli]|uniref:Uncharacterized protein n=1 Tax=Pedobacter frigidisoli TaxID=2530455 RepID=A0A4R0P467_9SPHI|nr:hypothetical protein [Pedobacter frigidisoli]TCD11665.1 hypothetical protein EZ449_05255 [Pedobacter frigidisoli]
MKSYQLKYHKNSVLLIAMLVIPFFFISLLFYILFSLPTSISELSILALVLSSIASVFLLLFWVKETQIFVTAKIIINNEGIAFELKKSSLFYWRTSFFSGWERVSNITEMFDNHNGGYFYQITFKNPAFTVNFSPLKNHQLEAEHFFAELQYYQENFNLDHNIPFVRNHSLKSFA